MPPRRGTPRILAAARGDEAADLLIKGGRVFVPGTREWVKTDLAVADGVIAGWGPHDAHEEVELAPNMIIVLHPHVLLPSGGGLWIGETFLVTGDGPVPLQTADRGLHAVPG